jgi:hypothetical protein
MSHPGVMPTLVAPVDSDRLIERTAMTTKKPGHSPKIESLAGKTLADPNAGKVAKKLAGAVLAHGDGKPNKKK